MAGFFNKVVATVGANSTAMMERAKINAAINNFENERQQLIQRVGQKIYDMYKAQGRIEADGAIMNFINEIDGRLDSIAHQQEQLKRVEDELALVTGGSQSIPGRVACGSCGHINRAGAKFCSGCGGSASI